MSFGLLKSFDNSHTETSKEKQLKFFNRFYIRHKFISEREHLRSVKNRDIKGEKVTQEIKRCSRKKA